MEEHILYRLARRYPQLLFPLGYDTKDSLAYKLAVRQGLPYSGQLDFTFSPQDRFTRVETPAGAAEVLLLENRGDFEHCLRALAYRCEPREVPASMGASTISGLINWEKIHTYLDAYEANGGTDRSGAFRAFIAEKKNYTDRLILLSSGVYSAVPPETAGLPAEEWREKSILIRQYHELTHFVCRNLYPENIDAVRDEILADMIGLLAAFGTYDPRLARVFLGVERAEYRKGGRLENYLAQGDPNAVLQDVNELIDLLCEKAAAAPVSDVFAFLLAQMEDPEIANRRFL